MRHPTRARWLLAAGAVAAFSTVSTSAADPKPKRAKSLGDCASFDQRDREDEDGVDFTIESRCEPKLACSIKWSLTCAPGTKKAKKTREAVAFQLENGQSESHTASAAACGFDGWQIGDIVWSCDPVK